MNQKSNSYFDEAEMVYEYFNLRLYFLISLNFVKICYFFIQMTHLGWKQFFLFMQCYIHEQITDKYNKSKLEGGCTMVQGCFRWFLVTSGAYITIVSRPYYYIPILSFVWTFDTYIVSTWIYIVMYHFSVILIW